MDKRAIAIARLKNTAAILLAIAEDLEAGLEPRDLGIGVTNEAQLLSWAADAVRRKLLGGGLPLKLFRRLAELMGWKVPQEIEEEAQGEWIIE